MSLDCISLCERVGGELTHPALSLDVCIERSAVYVDYCDSAWSMDRFQERLQDDGYDLHGVCLVGLLPAMGAGAGVPGLQGASPNLMLFRVVLVNEMCRI